MSMVNEVEEEEKSESNQISPLKSSVREQLNSLREEEEKVREADEPKPMFNTVTSKSLLQRTQNIYTSYETYNQTIDPKLKEKRLKKLLSDISFKLSLDENSANSDLLNTMSKLQLDF